MIIVVGRGHSGTRAISQTLSESGVFMGAPLNSSADLVPPGPMYDACRIFARHVEQVGELTWSWDAGLQAEIPTGFIALIGQYLASVHASLAPVKGFKIPETVLCLPWVVRLFPDAKYIFWIRDPRDCVIGEHLTDDLSFFGIPCAIETNERRRRAISWKYQHDLVQATPKPIHWIEVRFEDFILQQRDTLDRLEDFLKLPLATIAVDPDTVGRWRNDGGDNNFDFLLSAMRRYGYTGHGE